VEGGAFGEGIVGGRTLAPRWRAERLWIVEAAGREQKQESSQKQKPNKPTKQHGPSSKAGKGKRKKKVKKKEEESIQRRKKQEESKSALRIIFSLLAFLFYF
jgi:hypothetical protein